MKIIKLVFLGFFLLSLKSYLLSQSKEFVFVTPGSEYQASWFEEFFLGEQWRALWTTGITVEQLNLNYFSGGLQPVKQTNEDASKVLYFKANDETTWRFRSLNKYPSEMPQSELSQSSIGDFIRDRNSAKNPAAEIIVSRLLNAVDIIQVIPSLVCLPKDNSLGSYQNEFAGLLGFIEPALIESEIPKNQTVEIISNQKFIEKLNADLNLKVERTEYLKVRLMEMYFGSWYFYSNNWNWVDIKNDGKGWQPIPSELDEAFSKYGGLIAPFVDYLLPQLYDRKEFKFGGEKVTYNARSLDSRLLSSVSKTEWDSITASIYSDLNKDVINEAVINLPPEYVDIAGEKLKKDLLAKREEIFPNSKRLYNYVNEIVEIHTGTNDEFVIIDRISNDSTEISVGYKNDPFIKNERHSNELTNEYRVYLMDGEDSVVVKGRADSSPLVRIIGGQGKDSFVDSSNVSGYFIGFLPIADAETKTEFYDDEASNIVEGSGSKIINREDKHAEELYRQRGGKWGLRVVRNYSSDDGFILGMGPSYTSFNFRQYPFDYYLSATAAYATEPGKFIIEVESKFNNVIQEAFLNIHFIKSELVFNRYYGYGNETNYDESLDNQNYYRVNKELLEVSPNITFELFENNLTGIGMSYSYHDAVKPESNLLTSFPQTDYGTGGFGNIGINTFFSIDTRDVLRNTYYGHLIKVNISFFPALIDNKREFLRTSLEFRYFKTLPIFNDVTIALRAAGEKIWGDKYPFFYSVFLGGSDNLRGYSRERFSGDAAVFSQYELRFKLTKFNFIAPGQVGIFSFIDNGRVFTENNNSSRWHTTYGVGIYFSLIDRLLNFSATYAVSPEVSTIYVGSQLGF